MEKQESQLRKNMRLSIVEGVLAMPIVFLSMPGNFLLAGLATDTLLLSKTIYGAIASMPAWCNVAQLFIVPWLAKRFTSKKICLGFSWFHIASWMALALALPYLPRDGTWIAASFMIGIFAISSLTFAIINISWTSWMQEWLSNRARGKYLGRRNRILQVSTVVFLLAAGKTISVFASGNEIAGYQWIIGIGISLRCISIILQHDIFSSLSEIAERQARLPTQIARIAKDKALVRFFLFGAAFNFTASFMGPFFPVFLLKAIGMSIAEVGYLVTTATITGAISMPKWGELYDRFGCRSTMSLALIAWMANGYLFFLATPERTWIIYLIFAMGGIFGAGFMLGSFTMILKLVPSEAKTTAISLNMAITSMAGALSPILGGALIEWAEARYSDFLSIFHNLSALHHTLVLCTVFILLGVKEPKSSTLMQAAGAMRSFRQIGALMGLSFFANYTFFKKRPKR